jgi:alkanesulfonate monooxygenase
MNKKLRVFSAVSRNLRAAEYIDQVSRVARFGDHNGLTGVLLFAGNSTVVDPWPMAQHVMMNTEKSAPLIAVNPAYMHPFTVAKFVSSLALLYPRRIFLNMITGTATSDLVGLGQQLSHSDRYVRLAEFIHILRRLLAERRPLNFAGDFYVTKNLQLHPPLSPEFMPELLIAGQSDEAVRVAAETGCLMMQMLPAGLDRAVTSPGLNLGIFARPTRDQARRQAQLFFQDDAEKRALLRYSMENTDSVWKQRLKDAAQTSEIQENGYWMLPFLTSEADCPYLVGSYDEIGATLRRFVDVGVTTIILDAVASEHELEHIWKALASGEVI